MVYLLQDCYKDDCDIYHDILKIGFCSDDFNKSRAKEYNTHNYGYKLLSTIKHGSRDLETTLHNKFDHLRLSKDSEWFRYSDEIVKEFENYNKRWDIGVLENFEQLIKEIFYKGVTTSYSYINTEDYINNVLLDKYHFLGAYSGYSNEFLDILHTIRFISKEATDIYLEYYKTLRVIGQEKVSETEYDILLNNIINGKDIRTVSISCSGVKYNIKYSIKNIDPYISVRTMLMKMIEGTYTFVNDYREIVNIDDIDGLEYAQKVISLSPTFASPTISGKPSFNYQLLFLGRKVINKLESFIDQGMNNAAKMSSDLIIGKFNYENNKNSR
jgi:hypothetical protein